MNIHLLYQSNLEGDALSALLEHEGYQVSFDKNSIRIRDIFLNLNSSLLLIDTRYISVAEPKIINELCHRNKIILLGELNDLHWFFEFSCPAKGYISHQDTIKYFYRGIEKLEQNEIYVSPYTSEFLNHSKIKQQEILFERKLTKHLTKTELKLLLEIGRGKTTDQIAKETFKSIHTINNHRKNMIRKLGLEGIFCLTGFVIKKIPAIQTLVSFIERQVWIKRILKNNQR